MEGRPPASPRRRERVVFETDRSIVIGDVTLPPEGYQSRFSDAVNRGDVAFIPLIDVEISPLGGGESVVTQRFGHVHAASGLLHVAAAAIACASAVKPGPKPGQGRAAPWLGERAARVAVRSFS